MVSNQTCLAIAGLRSAADERRPGWESLAPVLREKCHHRVAVVRILSLSFPLHFSNLIGRYGEFVAFHEFGASRGRSVSV